VEERHTGADALIMHRFDHRASWAAHNWAWVLALGVVAVAFGVALVSSGFTSLTALVWLAGLFLLFAGVAELFVPLTSGTRSSRLAKAAIAIVAGAVLLAWPHQTLTVLAFVGGIAFIAWGLETAVLRLRQGETRWRSVVVGLALVVAGILMMVWPAETVTIVGVLLGLVAVVWGAATVLHALDLRRTGLHWEEVRRQDRERIDRAWQEFDGDRGAAGQPPGTKAA
jgi:uncharacterized membrane protein HdeD (DUF308 family)